MQMYEVTALAPEGPEEVYQAMVQKMKMMP